MTYYDDPNREALGLEPIWTGAVEVNPGGGAGDEEVPAEPEPETPVEDPAPTSSKRSTKS